ncbi:hypothetical protein HCN44_005978 [Aphidius gifuensis]|uniref:peptidylamidoglycolate lyase n=1 Tax=Aphidius gifuensis TaxID=684658 RepID=A0A834Y431_APHGI|nr:peptidyl-alpha-hydroxyglycine alpha-amidating lyase 2-like isoform X1 [Aphidius gifuensis]KAF7997407.1 hypothetical protein HCN44_005978 [Aphidius gifuensis]
MVGIFCPQYLTIVALIGLVSSFTIQTKQNEDVPVVVEELLNLLTVNSPASIEKVEVQRPGYPTENFDWQGPGNVGQIVGVSVDSEGRPVIFHRGDRTWNYNTYDDNLEYEEAFEGPIQDATILVLNSITGVVVNAWGEQIFYLPHGLHIDPFGYVWLTDVALHQVFKFKPGSRRPDLILGERFTRGSDDQHFCQPTAVAVAKSGEIVVADGYCNNRIMVFDESGNLINKIPQQNEFVTLRVPHGLAILDQGDVCVADRENMRIICLNVGLRSNNDINNNNNNNNINERRRPPLTLHQPDLGRVFAVAAHGNILYAVNGPTSPMIPIRGFIMDPKFEDIFGSWSPSTGNFEQPHAMAISPNGSELYVTEIGPNKIWKFDLVRGNRQDDIWNNLE